MTYQTSISLPEKHANYIDQQGLSPSKIIQNEIQKRIQQDQTEA